MKDEWAEFSKRLASAMRAAGYEARPSVLLTQFNTRYGGRSVSFQTASRWLNGRSIPEQDKLVVLAKFLKMTPHELRYGDKAVQAVREPRTVWPDDLSGPDRLAWNEFRSLSAEQRKVVREMIAVLASATARSSKS